MLQEISIRNFALIEEVRLTLGPGLNILTGETGAGKSILLDAVGLILGGRASADLVRTGTEKAVVEALFVAERTPMMESILTDLGIDWEEGTIIMTREVSANGKNVCRINGRLVTVQNLRQVGEQLLDVAGQHEHQSLQRPEEHLTWIDAFGGEKLIEQRRKVGDQYYAYREARRALEEAAVGDQERTQKIDILRFQTDEIRSATLQVGEEESLDEERLRLAHAEKLHGATSFAYEAMYQGDGQQQAVLDTLHKVRNELESAVKFDASLASTLELVSNAVYQLDEASHELRAYSDEIESNPAKLTQIEDRLATIHRLRKKYGESVDSVLSFLDRITIELDTLEHHEDHIERLQSEKEAKAKELATMAVQLSKMRQSAAKVLSTKIMDVLGSLMMPRTQFSIKFSEQSGSTGIEIEGRHVAVNGTGIDRVEFLFSPNAGEPLRPLAKIASGGELSRTMLALKTILADIEGVESLIFDEVDTGISGRAAQAVAEKMAIVAKNRQVICVTHLPQVACMADEHYLITKQQDGERSYTQVMSLASVERIEELARMLSGAEVTETTRLHAQEMLEMAQVVKAG